MLGGSIYQRGKTSWRIEISTGKQPDGTYGKVRETVRGSETDAKDRLAELLVELNRDEYIKESSIILSEFVETWLKHKKLHNQPNTYRFYKYMMEAYAIPKIGHIQLKKLKPINIQKMVDDLKIEKSDAVSQKAKATLSAALSYAVQMGLLRENPAKNITITKRRTRQVKKIDVWSIEEAKKILATCKGESYWIYFWIGLKTGMRPQEIYALRWENVDYTKKTIIVDEAIKQNNKDGVIVGDTKTYTSRTIPIDGDLIQALKQHKAQQNENKLKAGSEYVDQGLVFANPDGKVVNAGQLRKVIKRVTEKAGVPYIPPKNLRHTHATMLLSAGVHPKIVSERLGHSQISITLDIYSFALPAIQKEAVEELERHLKL